MILWELTLEAFMKYFFSLCSLISISTLCADDSFVDPRQIPVHGDYPDNPFYGIVGTGYAWTLDPGINNPNPNDWDAAIEGYDTTLGNAPFFMIGLGRQYFEMLHLDLSYTYYQPFHYEKFQTGTSNTVGFTGSHRVRFFDLSHQNILFDVSVYPWTWHAGCLGITPFAGAGVGVGFHQVTNFHTVGYTTAGATELGSTTSIGTTGVRAVFAWQVSAGIRFKPKLQHLSFDFGYHYYDGGSFYGPTNIVVNEAPSNGTVSFSNTPWSGHLKANEFYFTLNLAY